jgi:thiamine kinase-like enzyme
MSDDTNIVYDWTSDIEPHLDTMQNVVGGFTPAKRGVVTLEDRTKVFVKMATDENTAKWLKKEIKSYKKLLSAGYKHIPKLLSVSDDEKGIAIEYLEGASFENIWDKDKLDAVVKAQEALKEFTDQFIGDNNFRSDDVMDMDFKWQKLLEEGNLNKVNEKLKTLGLKSSFSSEQIEQYQKLHEGWSLKENALIHEDVRADNFGYDPVSKEGKLIDWNWLCVGDASLDTTPLFINMQKAGFDAYEYHPEKYDRQMIVYLIGFWLVSILDGNEDSSEREWRLRKAQADSLMICLELLNKY